MQKIFLSLILLFTSSLFCNSYGLTADFDTLIKIGNNFLSNKQYDAAIQQYQAALAVQPNDAEVYNNLGFAYYKKW